MADEELENRLRAHLERVSEQPVPRDLEARILTRTEKSKSSANWTRYGIMVLVTALTLILVLTLSGHEAGNHFSNISNGLTKPG